MAIRKDEVQLEVVANGNPARKALAELDMEAQKLKNTMRDNKRGTEEYINASKKLKEVEAKMANVRKEIGLNQMTLKELNKELASLKNKRQFIDPLSAAFKENRKQIEAVIARKKELETGLGKFGQAMSKIRSELMFVGVAGAATAVYTAISNIVKVNVEFEKSLRNLQAITGVGVQDLKFYAAAAKDIGLSTTTSASDAVEAFKLIASAKPDLLNAKEALVSVTKEAILLANASGLSLPEAATRLTDAMNQFSAPAREAGKYVNILAEGARLSAAEVPDITSSLLEFGVAAKSSNVSISESVALIETMAEKGVKGAEAGTKLRNVLAKGFSPKGLDKKAIEDLEAMGVNLDVLSNKNLSLQVRLEELAKIKDNDIALTHVFGLENKIAAQIILENTERVNELSVALGKDGLSAASDQAATNMDTLASASNKLTNTYNAIMTDENGGINGFLKKVINLTRMALLGLDELMSGKIFMGSSRDRGYNLNTEINNREVAKFGEKASNMNALELSRSLVDEINTIKELINKRKQLKKGSIEYDAAGQELIKHSKMKAIIYDNLAQIQKAEKEAANKSEALTKASVASASEKINKIEGHIAKVKELQSELFKLTGYKTDKEFFEAMEAENDYEDKLKKSRDNEEGERQRQNNIDLFGYGSLHELGIAAGNEDMQAEKDAAEKAQREAKMQEEIEAYEKAEKEKQDAQRQTFDKWLAQHQHQIDTTLGGLEKTHQIFTAYDKLKRVAEQAEIDRLGATSARAREIRIVQAKREKGLALAGAIIATAKGIAENLGNPLLAVAAGVMGGLQVATIAKTPIPEMRKGGILKGASHESPSRGINIMDDNGKIQARAEGGEALIAKATYEANKPLIDAMMNNYGKSISMDWLYKNTSANVSGFSKEKSSTNNSTTINNNYDSNSTDVLLMSMNKNLEKLIQINKSNAEKDVTISNYTLKKKNEELKLLENLSGR